MKQLLLSMFLLATVSWLHAADTVVKIAVGMDHQETLALLKRHGAEDITPHLAIVGPKGEHPLKGYVWELRDYGAIIEVDSKDNKVSRLIYGTTKDFDLGKDHRARTEQNVKSLTLDTKTRTVSVEK
jgi:hypothetical protein